MALTSSAAGKHHGQSRWSVADCFSGTRSRFHPPAARRGARDTAARPAGAGTNGAGPAGHARPCLEGPPPSSRRTSPPSLALHPSPATVNPATSSKSASHSHSVAGRHSPGRAAGAPRSTPMARRPAGIVRERAEREPALPGASESDEERRSRTRGVDGK